MKIRAELHLGNYSGKVILAGRPEETAEHLALKLAAVAMFLPGDPIVDPSPDHPALDGYEVRPDVCVLDDGGQIKAWIECGEVSINKIDKISRRLTGARIVVLKSQRHQALKMRAVLQDQIRQGDRVEIWTWPADTFKHWLAALEDKTELYGEAHERSFNLVVNNVPYAVDLVSL
jgi:uncharacterized protein YaeQ